MEPELTHGAAHIIGQLLLVFAAARLCGALAVRLGLPGTVGELMGGVLLAVLAQQGLEAVAGLRDSETVRMAANVGIFVLLLATVVEIRPRELWDNAARGLAVGLGGMALPLLFGIGFAYLILPDSDRLHAQALFVGVAMAITAVPVAAKILSDAGLLRGPVGRTVLAAAIVDDIGGLLLLAVMSGLMAGSGTFTGSGLLQLGLSIAAFFVITAALGTRVYPPIAKRLRALDAAALELSVLIAVALAYAWLAQQMGLHWIMGPIMAGIFFEPGRVGEKAYNEIRLILGSMAAGIMGPIFFAYIGLHTDLTAIAAAPGLAVALIALALLGKLFGAGLPAKMSGLSWREAAGVGSVMSARGAVELVVIGIAIKIGLFAGPADAPASWMIPLLVAMAVCTTLIAPILLAWLKVPPDRAEPPPR